MRKNLLIFQKKDNKTNLKNFKFFYSENHMTTFNGRLCSQYVNHPTLNPDFFFRWS